MTSYSRTSLIDCVQSNSCQASNLSQALCIIWHLWQGSAGHNAEIGIEINDSNGCVNVISVEAISKFMHICSKIVVIQAAAKYPGEIASTQEAAGAQDASAL